MPAGDELVDAVLGASRALVAVAARSLADVAEDVTLPQYRFLIELASRGPQRLADLATALGVDRSTATRMCDRLVRKRLGHPSPRPGGSSDGAGVFDRRRRGAGRRGESASAGGDRDDRASGCRRLDRDPVVRALRAFADAAGEVPEQDWSLGWDLD